MIALTNLRSKTLAILGIKVMTKFSDITYQVKLEDKSKSTKKTKFNGIV